jgi:hypothetical protein
MKFKKFKKRDPGISFEQAIKEVENEYEEFICEVKRNNPDLNYDDWIVKIFLPLRAYPEMDKIKLLPENIDQFLYDEDPLNDIRLRK